MSGEGEKLIVIVCVYMYIHVWNESLLDPERVTRDLLQVLALLAETPTRHSQQLCLSLVVL